MDFPSQMKSKAFQISYEQKKVLEKIAQKLLLLK